MKFKKQIKKISLFFYQNPILCYLILFIITFLFFTFLQNQTSFADPDSFYHAKISVLMRDEGIIDSFPYLQFTVLKDNFADHHFLYHLLLIPYTFYKNPLVGVKIATIFFASLTIVSFYWLLKRLKIKGPIIYTIILLVTNPFIFRINLAKAQALALIILFFAIYLIIHRKYFLLFTVSFFYVWLYGGWPLMLVITTVYIIASYIPDIKIKSKESKNKVKWPILWKHLLQKKLARQNVKLFFVVSSGLITGLIINPYFPKNFAFYWQQIIQIAVINYQHIIGVGGEWYPYGPLELLSSSVWVSILLIVAIILFFINFKKQSTISWTLFLLTIFFYIFTLKSRRNVEYFVPVAILFSAVSITQALKNLDYKKIYQEFKFVFESKVLVAALTIYLVLVPAVVARDLRAAYRDHHAGFSFNQFEKASSWLKENTKPGQIVFHSDWDEFPVLFYHNSLNYYIVGLDPTFMYNYNERLYWKWHNITIGEEKENLYSIIKEDFKADYVFVDLAQHELMDRNLSNNFYFEEVYNDKEVIIYKIN